MLCRCYSSNCVTRCETLLHCRISRHTKSTHLSVFQFAPTRISSSSARSTGVGRRVRYMRAHPLARHINWLSTEPTNSDVNDVVILFGIVIVCMQTYAKHGVENTEGVYGAPMFCGASCWPQRHVCSCAVRKIEPMPLDSRANHCSTHCPCGGGCGGHGVGMALPQA